MSKFLLLFIGIVTAHFIVTYGLLIFSTYEESSVVRGGALHMSTAGDFAANVAKVLSQPLVSIEAAHPDPTNGLQTFSFMLGNSAIWAVIIFGLWRVLYKALNKSNQQGPAAGTR
ncbi:hypothetical protein [Spongiibacter sp.]|uniref:hypothetical protein n=1 Tax=Spongiibacter sp. TaxID=2024860 RepID=UPI000C5CC05E|nr:hypothetical protein [Spongiibacter sp.]MBU72787.1 hypothetical protein [Spongiibacter sp.]|tara:strand:+ start:67 stop:411 length:345 start_codon:yes stop_codon:yes gene_type:complete